MKYVVTLRDRTYEVEVEEGEAQILDEYEALAPEPPARPMPASHGSASGGPSTVNAPSHSSTDSGTEVAAPLPGSILSIKVVAGQKVTEGDVLLLIEAMKMENEVVAPTTGTIAKIYVSQGEMVSTGDVLMVIE